jgi:cellulose 1,4-beta-cellobiosidase
MIYDVSISNSDSATCAATQFSVSPSLPSGWTSALSTPSVQLSPGATGHVTLTTMSAGGAAVGTYNVGVGVSDTMATAHGASGSGTYTVVAASDSAPPTSPTGLAGKLKSKQVTLTWKPASDNVGVAGYKIWRGGVVIATTTGTTWSESLAASGTYVYFVSAYDAAGNKSGASNSVTLTLGSGGRQR